MDYIATENLYASIPDQEGNVRVLKEDESPESRQFLIAAKGAVVPRDQAIKYGFISSDTPKMATLESAKAPLPPANPGASMFEDLHLRIKELETKVAEGESNIKYILDTAGGLFDEHGIERPDSLFKPTSGVPEEVENEDSNLANTDLLNES